MIATGRALNRLRASSVGRACSFFFVSLTANLRISGSYVWLGLLRVDFDLPYVHQRAQLRDPAVREHHTFLSLQGQDQLVSAAAGEREHLQRHLPPPYRPQRALERVDAVGD